MLLLNISSDRIFCSTGKELSNMGLEKTFPVFLKDLYDQKFYDKIFLINGPGSFTTLRVATLCINMLNFVFKNKIDFFSISKIDLYKYFFSKGFLPSVGYIFIGQKKNVWKYDFSQNNYETVSIDTISDGDFFVDKIYGDLGTLQEKMIDIVFDESFIVCKYNGKSLKVSVEQLNLKSTKSVAPEYMIQPNVNHL